jgi:hypothetical protein
VISLIQPGDFDNTCVEDLGKSVFMKELWSGAVPEEKRKF